MSRPIPLNEEPVEGIVIRLFPSRESDLVLKVISPQFGKVSFLAKHARKSKKRFGTTFDLFDKGLFSVGAGKGAMLLVDTFTPLHGFRKIRESLVKISAGSLVCEVIDVLTQEHEGEGAEPYHTLDLSLRAIDDAQTTRETLRALYLSIANLLTFAGYHSPIENEAPSAKKLYRLLQQVEESSGRQLESKDSLVNIISDLKKDEDAS